MAMKRRKRWSPELKEQLIRESFARSKDVTFNDFARSKGIDPSHLRSMAKRYLAAHPDFAKSLKSMPVSKLAPAPVPAGGFFAADEARKKQLLEEYLHLPISEKKPFREKYEVSQSMLTYYKNRFYGAGGTAVVVHNGKLDLNMERLVAEYQALPVTRGFKAAWLKEHGLNHQKIWEMTQRVMRARYRAIPEAIPADLHHIPITVPANAPSLDDAIAAMEVRRDMLDEFIGHLKRMRAGAK